MRLPFASKVLTETHPSRPLPWVPWLASALFVLGIVAVVATLVAVLAMRDADELQVRVVDANSSSALAKAVVTVNGTPYVADDDGRLTLPAMTGTVSVSVEHEGYRSKSGDLSLTDESLSWMVSLRSDAEAQSALASAAPSQLAAATTATAEPQQSQPVAVTSAAPQADPGVANAEASPAPATPAPASVELAGTILNAKGEPVQGALITDGVATEVTGADGLFALKAQDFASETLRISAPGYADTVVSFSQGSQPVTVEMQLQPIKAIYYNPNISNTEEDVDRLINLINTTEVNALVIDVKEEIIFYDSQVEFFQEVDTINPIMDLPALLARLKEHNIYTIARHVVFKDGLVAEARPDLAVLNNVTGEVWRDMNGVAWVNPMMHELWDANIALSVELAELGFDEIQYDYVRFPTDGDLSTMDFGLPYNEENRVNAITKFMKRSQEALLPTGAKLSADVFGFTVLVPDDLGIGQDLTELAPYLDYLSPMVYPSHFPNGAMGLDGHPNDYPYETIELSMEAGKSQLGSALQLRPWLQDFDFFDMIPYGVEEVRAQIDAAEDVGTSGWMLWDPNNVYTVGALGPDDGNMSRFQSPTAVLPGSESSQTLGRRSR